MGFPHLIELYCREESVTYNGTQVINTWYIEPFDSVPAFVSAMLGHVEGGDVVGVAPIRVFPAQDYKYNYCFASACNCVAFDPRQFSYMGTTNYNPQAKTLTSIVTAVQQNLDAKADWSPEINPGTQTDYSAGAFVKVTYLPLISYLPDSQSLEQKFNYINWRFTPRDRQNVINEGLKLITPFPGNWGYYPNAGIAPIVHEEYQHLTFERKMLPYKFDFTALNKYINCVNEDRFKGGQSCTDCPLTFEGQTLKFVSYKTEYVNVPKVDINGNPAGFWRFQNIEMHFDWRTITHNMVYNSNGDGPSDKYIIGWNHVLCYPGALNQLRNWINGGTSELGWYRGKFSTGAGFIATSDPYTLKLLKPIFEDNL